MTKIKALLFLLLAVAPLHAYQGGSLKNHAHTTSAGDGGALTVGTTLLGVSPLSSELTYRRPALVFVSTNAVTIETGTISNVAQATILFPDNDYRSDSNGTHIILYSSNTAVFNGTNKAGVHVGTTTMNSSYEVYAVKATNSSTDFVLVADSMVAIPANYTYLNSIYGTSGWVPLGLARVGDAASLPYGILSFVQNGNRTHFTNVAAGITDNFPGYEVTFSAGASALAYTYASGVGSAQIPGNATLVTYQIGINPGTTVSLMDNAGATRRWMQSIGTSRTFFRAEVPATEGCRTSNGSSVGMDIFVGGWVDATLGGGPNSLL